MTTRKKPQAEERDPLYSALIEHALDLIAMVDLDGTIAFHSPSVQRILGYRPDELRGKNAFDFIHADDRDRVIAEFQKARRASGPTPFVDYRFRHKNGSWRVLESVGSRFVTPAGTHFCIVNSRDITAHRALQEQCRHAQRIATLGRLATSVVHEFHNALQVMLGNVELVVAQNPKLAIPELDGVRKAGDIASQLARQLLNLARTTVSLPCRVDAHDTIVSLTTLLQQLVGRSIKIETNLVAHDAGVLARFGVLDQILVNLISNAHDAIPDTGTITISTRNASDHLILEVHDDGVGIPLRTQRHIFEPFFTTKETTKGTGLGLSTVRSIVEEAGGRIEVRSTARCGTTFSIAWPLARLADSRVARDARESRDSVPEVAR